VEIKPYIDELIADGCVSFDGSYLVLRNFVAAQEAKASDKVRKAHEREMDRAKVVLRARGDAQNAEDTENTQGECHADSVNGHGVLTSPAQPSPAQPQITSPEANASTAWGRVAEVWTRACVPAGFAPPRGTAAQKKKAAARMREAGWFEAFEAACAYVATEPFYRGANDRGWAATLGWFLEPGKTEKTAERAATKRPNPKDDHDATYRRLLDEAERELAGPNQRNGGNDRGTVAGDSRPGDVPAAPKALPPALGELLGGGWASRGLQDGAPVEPLPQRGPLPAKGAVRDS
jgi:hypothetical protein